MATTQADIIIEKLIANWAELYERRNYHLALFELQTITERDPENSLAHFLAGQTHLAMNRFPAAREAFAQAQQGKAVSLTAEYGRLARNVLDTCQRVQSALQADPHLAAPRSPFEWLEDPSRLGRPKPATPPRPEAAQLPKPAASGERPKPAPAPRPEPLRSNPAPAPRQPNAANFTPSVAASAIAPPAALKVEPVSAGNVVQQPAEAVSATMEDAWQAWEKRLVELLTSNNLQAALKQVDAALTRHPESHWLAEWRARILRQAGNKRLAAEQYLESARLAIKAGTAPKAEEMAKNAIALARGDGDLLQSIAQVLGTNGDVANSIAALREAEQEYRRSGETAKAVGVLRQLARQQPDDPHVQLRLASLSHASPAAQGGLIASRQEERGRGAYEHTRTLAAGEKANLGVLTLFFVIFGLAFGVSGIGVVPMVLFLVVNHWLKAARFSTGVGLMLRAASFILLIATVIGLFKAPYPF